jgi:hypothetical protein
VAWQSSHEAYGEAQVTSSLGAGRAFNIRFPGQYHDAETGLHLDGGRYSSVRRICEDLSIEAGNAARWKPPGRICIWLPGSGGIKSNEVAERAPLAEADKQDNRAKLRKAGTRERHLFVLVDQGSYLPWASLVDEEPPSAAPGLPAEITHIWAATIARDPSVVVVWRGSAPGWGPRQYAERTDPAESR